MATSVALVLQIVLVLTLVSKPSAQAQTFTVLYSFSGGTDGGYPWAGLIRGAAGTLYGTTNLGGDLTCNNFYGCGTVFKLDTTGTETVLYSFTGADGAYPLAGLIRGAPGNLYGTTEGGGTLGIGTVFKLTLNTTGNETVLHSFTDGAADGGYALAGLIRDHAGNLYGTTLNGGVADGGIVFKLDTTGKETLLHSFAAADGTIPEAGLIRDAAGNLYGTTNQGGAFNRGTVFKLNTTGKYKVLYSFTGGADGQYPFAALVLDAKGNLYGTTYYGGSDVTCNFNGCGTVFKLDRTGKETVLYRFTGGADGSNPSAGLIRDAAGNLYGTTRGGGDFGQGTFFKLDTTGKETVLHSFTGEDGSGPYGGVIRDAVGNLYGTTVGGGAFDAGTVFKLTP